VERLTPVFSGYRATTDDDDHLPWDEVPSPASGSAAFRIAGADPLAAGRLAASLEELAAVGVAQVAHAVADRVSSIIDLADEFGLAVVSPRNESERAGMVVVEPAPEQLTALTASLFNHGVAVTSRLGTVRISAHAGTTPETLGMLRAAFTSYATAIRIR
jgi:kynureninase